MNAMNVKSHLFCNSTGRGVSWRVLGRSSRKPISRTCALTPSRRLRKPSKGCSLSANLPSPYVHDLPISLIPVRDNPFGWDAYVIVCAFSAGGHRVRFSRHSFEEGRRGKV